MIRRITICLAIPAIIAISPVAIHAQNSFPSSNPIAPTSAAQNFLSGAQATDPNAERRKEAKKFNELINELRRESDEEAKTEKRNKVKDLLGKQLERDLQEREEKLVEIEERAKKLREQLEARRASKDEMLKLLMMLVENPGSGFGLPDDWMRMLINGSHRGANATFPERLNDFNNIVQPTPLPATHSAYGAPASANTYPGRQAPSKQ